MIQFTREQIPGRLRVKIDQRRPIVRGAPGVGLVVEVIDRERLPVEDAPTRIAGTFLGLRLKES